VICFLLVASARELHHPIRLFYQRDMAISVSGTFQRSTKYENVRPIHIYLLRLLYILMFFVLGRNTWTQILTHKGPWDPTNAVVWCVWTAFATLAGIGIIRPLKMLPIILLEIFYKCCGLSLWRIHCGQRVRWRDHQPKASPRRSHG
jgi:hypothetical protein